MRSGLLLLSLALLSLLAVTVRAQEAGDKVVSIGQAADHAVQQSKLTLPGGTPFHLKAHIANTGSAKPEYSADVEEYWVSPEKWRRTVQSAGFSQTLIVNGGKISEKLTGDYYPFWLHDLVTALFDPLPMVDQLRAMRGRTGDPGRFSQIKLMPEHAIQSGDRSGAKQPHLCFLFRRQGWTASGGAHSGIQGPVCRLSAFQEEDGSPDH